MGERSRYDSHAVTVRPDFTLELLSYAEDFERTRQGTSGGERIAQFLDGAVMDSDAATSSEEDDGAKQTKAAKLVTISTMHAAKGLEWPIVVPINTMTGIMAPESAVTDRESDTFYCPVFGVKLVGYDAARDAEKVGDLALVPVLVIIEPGRLEDEVFLLAGWPTRRRPRSRCQLLPVLAGDPGLP